MNAEQQAAVEAIRAERQAQREAIAHYGDYGEAHGTLIPPHIANEHDAATYHTVWTGPEVDLLLGIIDQQQAVIDAARTYLDTSKYDPEWRAWIATPGQRNALKDALDALGE